MAYEIAPVSGFPATPATQFPPVPVRVINFTGTAFTCSRGTGEQSNVITIRMEYTPALTGEAPWNSSNAVEEGTWVFAESDYLATADLSGGGGG